MATETKDKILDTAERLFAENGFDATSLRTITAEAKVNLAAVHYHFHGKDSLLDAIILRKLARVNREREMLLDRFEAESPGAALPIEKVLEALIAPTFAMAGGHPQFVKLMGRLQAEGLMTRLMTQHFQPLLDRFLTAIHRALPGLEIDDLLWRVHFAVGAMAHALRNKPELSGAFTAPPLAPEAVSRQLVAFLAAGFRGAVPQE